MTRSPLLRQPDFTHQLSKSWVGMQGIEQEVGLQTRQIQIALLIRDVQPPESLLFVPQSAYSPAIK